MSATIFYGLLLLCGMLIIFGLIKNKFLFRGLFTSAALGCCALFAVRLTGLFFSISLPLNPFTATVSIFGGIPGVILLLLGECICNF